MNRMNEMLKKRATTTLLKILFILAPSSSREKLKSHLQRWSRPCYHFPHHYSPPQTLDVLQVVNVPHKTCCPEPSTDSRQSLINKAVSERCISSSHLNTLSFLTELKNCWHTFNGHITLLFHMKIMLRTIFYIDCCKHKYPPAWFTHFLIF